MITSRPRVVDLSEVEPNRRRGGDLRAMLTPATVGSTSGFMGVRIISPGERIAEHYHPYSEEFVYVVSGAAGGGPRRRGAVRFSPTRA